jgi:hypothetical protein
MIILIRVNINIIFKLPLLFNVFINDICDAVAYSKYLLFADDVRIYLDLLRTAVYFSLTLNLYKVGALLTV